MWGSEEGRGRRLGSLRSLTLAAESNTHYGTLYTVQMAIIRFVAEIIKESGTTLIKTKMGQKKSVHKGALTISVVTS